jgi:hypothetical protein
MNHPTEPDDRGRGGLHAPEANGRDVLELWMALSRWEWRSLVLVPTDPGSSTASLARSLAEIGQRLCFGAVNAISLDSLEYGSALALADLQQHIGGQPIPAAPQPSPVVEGDPAAATDAPQTQVLMRAPVARLIISIPPVVREPLGIPAAREADTVVVCLRLGRSRVPDLKRTVDLIGREKVAGTVLLR